MTFCPDPSSGTVADALAAENVALRAEVVRLQTAFSGVLVGGNHLASQLTRLLGANFATKYPPSLEPLAALELIGANVEYDMWCCWRSIMRAREALSPGDATDG